MFVRIFISFLVITFIGCSHGYSIKQDDAIIRQPSLVRLLKQKRSMKIVLRVPTSSKHIVQTDSASRWFDYRMN